MKSAVLFVLLPALGLAQTRPELAAALDAILAEPASKAAISGVLVVELAGRNTLYELNADVPFVPASNTKLFSTALALSRLGPDYHFETKVFFEPASKTLTLLGGGDPTLTVDEGLDDLAAQVQEAGITVVEALAGDESLYVSVPYSDGWAVNDTVWGYGAPVSALTINENTLKLSIEPGDPALMRWTPAVEFLSVLPSFEFSNEGDADLSAERAPGSSVVRLYGRARPRPQVLNLANPDPARVAAEALASALRHRGIEVRGPISTRRRVDPRTPYLSPPGQVVAWRLSPPLIEVLRTVNKDSHNLFAELVLRETGRATNGESGLRELAAFLGETGVPETATSLEDGSGLDRRNLVTPRAVLAVLQRMHDSLFSDLWWSTLPIAATDGTLQTRFRAVQDASSIRAKTGTISHVSALSGYAGLDPENRVAFSILFNNYAVPTSAIRALIDRLGAAILQHGVK